MQCSQPIGHSRRMATILFITRVVSPFQVELGQAVRDLGHDAHLLFSNGDIGTRPSHWQMELPDWSHAVDIESNPLRLSGLLDEVSPQVIVYGGYRGAPVPVAKRLARKRGIAFGFWLEQPFPTSTWRRIVRDVMIERALSGADFVLSIGPRALSIYEALMRDRGRLYVLPYGQDLSKNYEFLRKYTGPNGGVTFLFSGKYQHRNNIWELLSAFASVRRCHGERAKLLLSGYSGMDREIRSHVAGDSTLAGAVTHDVEFATWEDRLRPFKRADVLLMPGVHAGWGLVVPEAMSLGMPVIAGSGIESALMLVRPGLDGFIVGPSYVQIEDAMNRVLENPGIVEKMGTSARERSKICDAPQVAQRLIEILRPHLG
jgi:glycosyltransferase involved in cell wall biosynthesis